jgi:hypothetical protein
MNKIIKVKLKYKKINKCNIKLHRQTTSQIIDNNKIGNKYIYQKILNNKFNIINLNNKVIFDFIENI